MSDAAQYRLERIKRLLSELEYEVVRGMMEGELDETIQFRFLVPISKRIPGGVVACHFDTRPMQFPPWAAERDAQRLRLVKK